MPKSKNFDNRTVNVEPDFRFYLNTLTQRIPLFQLGMPDFFFLPISDMPILSIHFISNFDIDQYCYAAVFFPPKLPLSVSGPHKRFRHIW